MPVSVTQYEAAKYRYLGVKQGQGRTSRLLLRSVEASLFCLSQPGTVHRRGDYCFAPDSKSLADGLSCTIVSIVAPSRGDPCSHRVDYGGDRVLGGISLFTVAGWSAFKVQRQNPLAHGKRYASHQSIPTIHSGICVDPRKRILSKTK